MGQGRTRPTAGGAESRRQMLILHVAMVGLFLLDLALPRNIPLLPYYFLVVLLSASFATPRQMVPLVALAYGLAIASGLHWGFLPSYDYFTRLVALSGAAGAAIWLSAQRSRELARRRRSEQILSLTLDNSTVGVGLTDASGRFFRVNSALCDILGRDADTIRSLRWTDCTHPDDVGQEQVLVEEILANRRSSYRIKVRLLRGDSSTIWVDLSVSCSRQPSGDVDFLIGQLVDITAQVEAEQSLVRSKEMMSRTLEQCGTGLALCSPGTGAILQVNSELCSELNLTPASLIGSNLTEVIGALEQVSAEDGVSLTPMDQAPLEALLRGDIDCYGVRVRLLRAGHLRGWGDLEFSNLRDASGAVMNVLLELDDITDLVAQTEYLQAAAAAGVVGIWDWDPVNDMLTWDPVMYQLYGIRPEQFSGAVEAWGHCVHPDDRAAAEAELQAAVRGELQYAASFRILRPDGEIRHLRSASRTFFDTDGRAVQILGVNYDVTELVQTQEQLQAEQNRLSTTLDSLLDPHLMLGPVRDDAGCIVDLRILRANPAAAAYNNMALEAFVGTRVRQFWSEHVACGLFDRYLEVLSSDKPLVLDNFPMHHAQQGGLRHFDIRAVKVGEELSVTWRDVSERIAMAQALERRAATDSLTTLLNREEMFNQMERLLAGDRRRGGQLAVLFCDLDRFKEVNDTYGHQAGDAVLQAMAQRIRSCLRGSDLAARMGGDELMVVLPGVQGLPDALAIAEKLRRLACEPVPIPQGQVLTSISVGVAVACAGESLDELIARADTAMYTGKKHGRNQVVAIS
jgi:diguanylate cyclase (GGDEF)-like protein/PAS domain S-box-containing protein